MQAPEFIPVIPVQHTCDGEQDAQFMHAGWLQVPQQGTAVPGHVPPPGDGLPDSQMVGPSATASRSGPVAAS
jgi:hypothetical protein